METKTVIDWFNERGKQPLEYQPITIIKTIESKKKKVVLAAAPNSGKTTMSICIIDLLKRISPDIKVLILTHNQVILRKNFSESIEELGRPFDYQVIEDCNNPITKNILIGIPAGLKNCKNLPKVDLVIVDEAHEYYSEKMVKSIIRKVSPEKEILLTGTPSPFNGDKQYEIVYVTGIDVYKAGNSAEVYKEICTSTYFIDKTQYTSEGEVKSSYNFGKTNTEVTLDDVMSKVYDRLISKMRKPKNYAYSPLVDWIFLNKNMGRTFIACRNQPQAKKVAKYFESKGIKTMISTSDTDNDNGLLNSWKEDQSYRVLIVVRKGVLGFSDSSIVNLVDMTMSKNINRMFQLYNRVTRKLGNTKKLYIKVVPANLSDYHMVYVTGMLCMLHEEWYTKFNGKNFYEMKVPLVKRPKRRSNGVGDGRSGGGKVKPRIEDIGCIEPSEIFEYLKSNKSKLFNPEACTDMRTVINRLHRHYGIKVTYSKKDVEEVYSKYENQEFDRMMRPEGSIIAAARRMGIHEKLMEKYNIKRTWQLRNEEEIEKFIKDNNITKQLQLRKMGGLGTKYFDWLIRHPKVKNRLLPSTKRIISMEELYETMKKYEYAQDFKKNHPTLYNKARRKNVLYSTGLKRKIK